MNNVVIWERLCVLLKHGSKFEKEWYYDDLDIPDAGEFDEPDADSDYDYDDSYSRKKKKRGVAKSPRGVISFALHSEIHQVIVSLMLYFLNNVLFL